MSESFASQGYVIEVQDVPRWFPRALEAECLAFIAARTLDGIYVEPTGALDEVIALLEAQELGATAVRYAGAPASWHEGVKAARLAERRLRNRRAAEWLPTFRSA